MKAWCRTLRTQTESGDTDALPTVSEPVNFVGKLHSAWAHYRFKHRVALISQKSLVGVGDAHRQDLYQWSSRDQ